jgi:cytochrome c-type biogenesis protein CcmH
MRALVLALLVWAVPVLAVQPDEMLDDPILEARARALSEGLRCPVCRNESIDESNATVARDLRLLVRELLVDGLSDAEVMDTIVARYGEYVLLRPEASGSNLILWLAAPALLLAGAGIGLAAVRKRSAEPEPDGLSQAEKARLEEILKS